MAEPIVFAERQTLWFWPSMQTESMAATTFIEDAYAGGGINGNLLRQDCHNVLSYEREFRPEVIADDATAATEVVLRALEDRRGDGTLNRVLRDFFQVAADRLLRHQNAYYEIVYGYRPGQDASRPVGFRLMAAPLGTVGTRAGQLVQYVPAAHAKHSTALRGVGYNDLSADTLVLFRLKDDLQCDVEATFKALASAHESGQTFGAAGSDKTIKMLNNATAALGWNRFVEPVSNSQLLPYKVWRQLEFLAFKIKVRESILASLNDVLNKVGRRLHTPMHIKLHNVPSLDDVRVAHGDLQQGQRSLEDIAVWAASQ